MTSSSASSPEMTAATSQDHFSYKNATQDEVLEDLSSRFILNLPDDELSSLERICFQVEQAHWFYEDFIREENPNFPSLPLKKFSAMLFHACPLLHQWSHDHEQAFNTFMQYKTRVPVCGAIMLNATLEKCLLVKGWKSSSGWGFPKGKINQVELPASCAIREVLEETGYNLAGQIEPSNVIEMNIREQKISLFIVTGIPEDFPFKTKTRKEISRIEWFRLSDLPTWKRNKSGGGKFYLISPFIGPLKSFINERKSRDHQKSHKARKERTLLQSQSPSKLPQSIASDATSDASPTSSSAENSDSQVLQDGSESRATSTSLPASESSNLETTPVKIDPHFAQLLSSLAISASQRNGQTPSLTPTDIHGTSQAINISASGLNTQLLNSSTSPKPQEAPTHIDTIHPDVKTPSSHSPIPLPQTPRPPTSFGSVEPFRQPSRPILDTIGGSQPITTSFLPKNSDEGVHSSTLSAPFADRSKHIALLEAVSAESARLMQAYKAAASSGTPLDVSDSFKSPKLSVSTLTSLATPRISYQTNDINASGLPRSESFVQTPSTLRPSDEQPNIFYASGSLKSSQPDNAIMYESNVSHTMPNLLQPRPWTSASYHHTPITNLGRSGSMNQNQLLALMNGPASNSSRTYNLYDRPPQNVSVAQSHYHAHVPQRSPVSHHSQFTAYNSPTPFSPLHVPTQVPTTVSNTLLSIINNSRNASQVQNIPPHPPFSIGRG